MAASAVTLPSDSVSFDTVQGFPSHAAFVRQGMSNAADSLFASFTFSRARPLWIPTDTGKTPDAWFDDAITEVLSRRGYIVSDGEDTDTSVSRLWTVRYRVDRLLLTLPETTRHSFLGRIWVRRQFETAVRAEVWDRDSGESLWSDSVVTRVSDWVPKRRLKVLSRPRDSLLSPVPPTTMLEKLTHPLVVSATASALAAVFFLVR